jgi:hypothetical protein
LYESTSESTSSSSSWLRYESLEPGLRLGRLLNLVHFGKISETEAHRLARGDSELLRPEYVDLAVRAAWQISVTDSETGTRTASLIHAWAGEHQAGNQEFVHDSSRVFVRAATQVLGARWDGRLYHRAAEAAEDMLRTAEPSRLGSAAR